MNWTVIIIETLVMTAAFTAIESSFGQGLLCLIRK